MKRHVALHPLSQHHHFALMEALFIRRALREPAAGRKRKLEGVVKKFLRFWKKAGQQHFREEEEILLPTWSRHVRLDEDPLTMRLLAEHALIRAQIADLEAAVAAGQPVEELAAELARLLHDHVRFEENEVFPRAERLLNENELAALGRRLSWLHPKRSCEI